LQFRLASDGLLQVSLALLIDGFARAERPSEKKSQIIVLKAI